MELCDFTRLFYEDIAFLFVAALIGYVTRWLSE